MPHRLTEPEIDPRAPIAGPEKFALVLFLVFVFLFGAILAIDFVLSFFR
jgi:hypothetical protein